MARHRDRSPTPLTVAAIWAALLLGVAGLLGSCSNSSSPAANDVTVTSCAANANGSRPVASGTVVNHSSKASTYAFTVTFYDSSGNKVSQGAASLGKVEPGATSTFTAGGVASAVGPLTCKVSSVVRTEAP